MPALGNHAGLPLRLPSGKQFSVQRTAYCVVRRRQNSALNMMWLLSPQVTPGVLSARFLLFFAGNEFFRLGQKALDFYVLSKLLILTQFPQLLDGSLRFLNPADFM